MHLINNFINNAILCHMQYLQQLLEYIFLFRTKYSFNETWYKFMTHNCWILFYVISNPVLITTNCISVWWTIIFVEAPQPLSCRFSHFVVVAKWHMILSIFVIDICRKSFDILIYITDFLHHNNFFGYLKKA